MVCQVVIGSGIMVIFVFFTLLSYIKIPITSIFTFITRNDHKRHTNQREGWQGFAS